jgi:tripartite-type tricarboxylate transporter receptor subunit TctC
MITRRGLSTLPLLALPAVARAQDGYPNRPIRILVGYPAGGGQDLTARLLAEPLRAALGQPVVVENRSGASGMIAADAVAKAAPDGYTLLLGGAGECAANGALFRGRISYDPVRDLVPIHISVQVPCVVMGNPAQPFTDIPGLIAYAKRNPGRLSYSSSGIGNPQHLAGELFNFMAGTDTVHVPYRGSGPAVTDIASGQVQFGYNSLAAGLSLIQEGRIRALGVTSKERMPQLPNVASVSEFAPMREYELVNWFGLFGPGPLPPAIVERLNRIVDAAVNGPELRPRFDTQGLLVQSQTPAQARAFVVAEAEKLGKVVTDARITVEG